MSEEFKERTDEEIVAKIREWMPTNVFGFGVYDLISYLPLEAAKEFITLDDEDAAKWKPLPRDRASIEVEIKSYIPFAWDKANNRRGISALRSMCHFHAWIWMLDELDKVGDLLEYDFYGKDNLRKICEVYGLNPDKWDDGLRVDED